MEIPSPPVTGRYAAELAAAEQAARAAGVLLAAEFLRPGGPRGHGHKCQADTDAERVIREQLAAAFPEYGFQAEEEEHLDRPARDPGRHVWVVDPNDGTAHYLRGARGASVSIALLRDNVPVLGVVFAHTALHGGSELFTWAEESGPVRRDGVPIAPLGPRGPLETTDLVLVAPSAEHAVVENAELVAPARFRTCPSIAYRLALVAAGDAVATLSVNAPGPIDYAAGHALIRGVGGELVDGRGVAVRYGDFGRSTPALFAGPPAIARALASRHWSGVVARRRRAPSELCEPAPGVCATDAGVLRRAQGALLGQLAGDALGAQVEFRSARSIAEEYPTGVLEIRDGGTWNTLAGQPTDDSELALALARVLAEQGWDPARVATAYARWYGSGPFDCGGTTRAALSPAWAALQRGADPARAVAVAASTTVASKANGALMRVSPLGVFGWHRPVEELAGWAREDARLTHPNRTCQDASAVFVAALALAVRAGADPAAVHAHAIEVARSSGAAPEVLEALERAATEPPPYTPQDGFVLVALQNAFFQLLHARSLEEGLIATVAGGGDTDTNAAIAGALLGAVHGAEAVPLRWRNAVLSCRPLAGLPGVKRPRPTEYWPVDALVLAERLVAQGGASRP